MSLQYVKVRRRGSARSEGETITLPGAAELAGVALATIKHAVACGDLQLSEAFNGYDYLDKESVRAWAVSKRLIFA